MYIGGTTPSLAVGKSLTFKRAKQKVREREREREREIVQDTQRQRDRDRKMDGTRETSKMMNISVAT